MKDAKNDAVVESAGVSRPLVFGEVLFDHFPDGRKILGGAPFNVAWNLRGLGFDPKFVSGVGCDAEAAEIRRTMASWGMDANGLQSIDDRPTGRVSVTMVDNQPSYVIDVDQAYDFVAAKDVSHLHSGCSLLYHGSLIYRGDVSRQTLRRLISDCPLPRFVDINIRQPHFDVQWLSELLRGARWIKLNDEELELIAGTRVRGQNDIETGVAKLQSSFGPATYFVTCGSRGAYALDQQHVEFSPPAPVDTLKDSVGAGDAFAAATIGGLLEGKSPSQSLHGAVRLASRVCCIQGATSNDRSLYEHVDA